MKNYTIFGSFILGAFLLQNGLNETYVTYCNFDERPYQKVILETAAEVIFLEVPEDTDRLYSLTLKQSYTGISKFIVVSSRRVVHKIRMPSIPNVEKTYIVLFSGPEIYLIPQ